MSGPFLPGYDEWLEKPYEEPKPDRDGPDPDAERERLLDRAAEVTERCVVCRDVATSECSVCHVDLCEKHEFSCPNEGIRRP